MLEQTKSVKTRRVKLQNLGKRMKTEKGEVHVNAPINM